jgi:uncharacterized protein (DUF2141 family)
MRRCLALLVAAFFLPAAAPPPPLELTVEIVALRSSKGQVLVSLFNAPDGFPDKAEKALARFIGRIEKARSTVKFKGLRPGFYAVAAIHDENGNRKLDKNWAGIPKEGIAVSNNAKSKFGPPKFKDARFRLEKSRTLQRLRMYYY